MEKEKVITMANKIIPFPNIKVSEKAKKSMQDSIVEAYNWKDFLKAAKQKKLIKTHFCGTTDCEDHIKDKTDGVTSRCIPIGEEKAPKNSKCVHCGKPAEWNIYFSKSY